MQARVACRQKRDCCRECQTRLCGGEQAYNESESVAEGTTSREINAAGVCVAEDTQRGAVRSRVSLAHVQ